MRSPVSWTITTTRSGDMEDSPHACGICGSLRTTDLAHGRGEDRRIVCFACGGQFWKQWYTRKDWEVWINEGYEHLMPKGGSNAPVLSVNDTLKLLENLQKADKEFQAEKLKTTAATFCCSCRGNKPVGLYPFWHRFGRVLCDSCGREYTEFLKRIGASGDL